MGVRDGILNKVREKVKPRLADFDVRKLFMNATHTHNAPVTLEGRYTLPEKGNMKPAEYTEFMTTKVADAVVEAWQRRQAGKVGWGLGHAVVAQDRRAVYANGTAQMYGATNTKDFRGIEGYEDHSLDVLFFWDQQDQLTATVINVPCPAQEAEGGLAIHADFWHPVRERLRQQHGKELLVLGWAWVRAAIRSRGPCTARRPSSGCASSRADRPGGGRPPHCGRLGGSLRRSA